MYSNELSARKMGGAGRLIYCAAVTKVWKGRSVVPSPIKRLSGLWTDESEISAVELGDVVADRLSDTASCLQTDGSNC